MEEDLMVISELTIQHVLVNGRDAVVLSTPSETNNLSPTGIAMLGMIEWAKALVVKDMTMGTYSLDEDGDDEQADE